MYNVLCKGRRVPVVVVVLTLTHNQVRGHTPELRNTPVKKHKQTKIPGIVTLESKKNNAYYTPSVIFALFLSLSPSLDVSNSGPGSLSRLFFPLSTTVRASIVVVRRLLPFVASLVGSHRTDITRSTSHGSLPGVFEAENDLSTCQYLEYPKLKMTEYLPVPGR